MWFNPTIKAGVSKKKKEIMNFLTTTFDIKVFALFKAFGTRATITSRLMIVIQFQIRSLY